jgi:hypothetical protein
MPVLNNDKHLQDLHDSSVRGRRPGFLSVCANPKCASSWLHVWRNRTTPVLEGGWSCSSSCTRARLARLLRREGERRDAWPAMYRHKIPIGLVLLERKWIAPEQLKKGLDEQRSGRAGRLGKWLMDNCGLDEARLTQALSIQWNCPVLPLDDAPAFPALSPVPRLFLESFQFFPLRQAGVGPLYIAFEGQIDHSVTLAIERVTGHTVEAGLVNGSDFEREHRARLGGRFCPTRIIEAAGMDSLLQALTSLIEKAKPVETRVVRMHDFYWLRLWKDPVRPGAVAAADGIEDVICSMTAFR